MKKIKSWLNCPSLGINLINESLMLYHKIHKKLSGLIELEEKYDTKYVGARMKFT